MQPIGLCYKSDNGANIFTNNSSGELMIVHQCLQCGRISPNRMAGDDDEQHLLSLLDNPDKVDSQTSRQLLNREIILLTLDNREEILIQLYGWNYENHLYYNSEL